MSSVSIVEGNDGRKTEDIRLAAALLAVGVKPQFQDVGFKLVRPDRPGNWQEFYFEPRSACGKYETKALMDAWSEGLAWIEKNPEHPFAYIMAAMMNHRDLRARFQSKADFAFMQKGKSVALIPMDASARLEERILGKW